MENFVKKTIDRRRKIFTCDTLAAGIPFIWGVNVFNPFVDTFSDYRIFDPMARLAPELFWGFAYTVFSVLAFFHIYREHLHAARLIYLTLLFVIAACFLQGNPTSYAFQIYLYPVIFIGARWFLDFLTEH